MSSLRHRRRDFLVRALATVGSPGLLAMACHPAESHPVMDDSDVPHFKPETVDAAAAVARGYFSERDLASAQLLGAAYLELLQRDDSEHDIIAVSHETITLIDEAPSDDAALAQLEAAVGSDFMGADTAVDLEGWQLARTELQLCALTLLP